ncbi:DUF7079 family protein [Providencia burhodogranariea]|uniref:DUF7079 family protein n=1 Tax=Providencia burhodogranariea TaxID=516074 RepID=UPI003AF3304C
MVNTSKLFTDKDLCFALSDIFVDNLVNVEYIASVAKHFPVEYVQVMLCRYVAPICYCNMLLQYGLTLMQMNYGKILLY